MKNNLNKWIVGFVLIAIIFNLFNGFNTTANANEINLEPTEAVKTEVTEQEKPKIDESEMEIPETKESEQALPGVKKDTESEKKVEEKTTSPLKEKSKTDTQILEDNPTEEPVMGEVEVNYYLGNDLVTEIFTGEVGTEYNIKIREFPGYRYVEGERLKGIYSEYKSYAYLIYFTEKISINMNLYIGDGDNSEKLRPKNITVKLLRNGVEVKEKSLDLNDANDYELAFEGKYDRFNNNGSEYKYSIVIEGLPKEYYINEDYLNKDVDKYRFDLSANILLGNWDIHVKKFFDEYLPTKIANNNEDANPVIPSEVTIHLLRNGEDVEGSPFKLNDENSWEITFYNLPRFDENGNEYIYTVEEEPVEGFYPQITKSVGIYDKNKGAIGYLIENKAAINVTATKVWDGGPKAKPNVTLQLYQEINIVDYPAYSRIEPYGDPVTLVDGMTSYTWENLPIGYYNQYSNEYYVKEINVPEDYTASYSEDKLTVTNTYTGEMISVEGTKTWKDNENEAGKRPESITVNLLENGTKIESLEVTAKDNWKYSFKDLPKTKESEEIIYTVTEDKVEEYATSIDGYDITNTYIREDLVELDETREIKGTKTWDDNDNKAGKRPEYITVNLMADGIKIYSIKVTEKDDWKYSFKDLEVEKDGKKIVYTLSEDTVKDYKTSFDGANITNKYVEKVETKTSTKNSKTKLPKTGVVALTGITVLGVVLLALGGYTAFKKKSK